MNRLFTAETRPRFSSGVSNCTNVCRTTTLTLSTAPHNASIANENQNHLERPNAIVATPNATTPQSSARPAFSIGGRCARNSAHTTAPMGNAAYKIPKPAGPAWRMSSAYTGSNMVAPPRNTANMSSVMMPRIIRVEKTNLNPVTRLFSVMGSGLLTVCVRWMYFTSVKQVSAVTAFSAYTHAAE